MLSMHLSPLIIAQLRSTRAQEIEMDQNVVIVAVVSVDKLTCSEPPEICNTLLESYQRSINQ